MVKLKNGNQACFILSLREMWLIDLDLCQIIAQKIVTFSRLSFLRGMSPYTSINTFQPKAGLFYSFGCFENNDCIKFARNYISVDRAETSSLQILSPISHLKEQNVNFESVT